MGLLIRLAFVLAIAGCYAPDVRDCTRSCASDDDCVSSQVCTTDHFCAAPGLATGCTELVHDASVVDAPDGHPPPHDAMPPHDAPMPDAWPTVNLMIQIDGSGMVTLTGGGTCDATACTLPAPKGLPATLTAVGHGTHTFEKWTSTTCANQPAVCTFTPTAATTVSVKFH